MTKTVGSGSIRQVEMFDLCSINVCRIWCWTPKKVENAEKGLKLVFFFFFSLKYSNNELCVCDLNKGEMEEGVECII